MIITRFEDIESWQLGRVLTRCAYDVTKTKAAARDQEFCRQIQSASSSIMHNIAEGFDAGSNPEFIRFLKYSRRSASEVQSELYVAIDQAYIDQPTFDNLYEQARVIKAKINGFIKYLRSTNKKQQSPNNK